MSEGTFTLYRPRPEVNPTEWVVSLVPGHDMVARGFTGRSWAFTGTGAEAVAHARRELDAWADDPEQWYRDWLW